MDEVQIPTGEILPVKGTPFDFTSEHRVGDRMEDVPGGLPGLLTAGLMQPVLTCELVPARPQERSFPVCPRASPCACSQSCSRWPKQRGWPWRKCSSAWVVGPRVLALTWH